LSALRLSLASGLAAGKVARSEVISVNAGRGRPAGWAGRADQGPGEQGPGSTRRRGSFRGPRRWTGRLSRRDPAARRQRLWPQRALACDRPL